MAVDLQAPRVRSVKEWQFDFAHGLTTVGDEASDASGLPFSAPLLALLNKITYTDVAKGSPNNYRAFCVQQQVGGADGLYFSIGPNQNGTVQVVVQNYTGSSVDLTGGTVKIIVQQYRSNRSR